MGEGGGKSGIEVGRNGWGGGNQGVGGKLQQLMVAILAAFGHVAGQGKGELAG